MGDTMALMAFLRPTAGGGAPPTDGGALNVGGSGSEILPTHRSQMTPRRKVDFIRDNGNESYQSLPW